MLGEMHREDGGRTECSTTECNGMIKKQLNVAATESNHFYRKGVVPHRFDMLSEVLVSEPYLLLTQGT